MVTALYRRYRPETFAELIGQTQVTSPLMTALRTDRVNHAYLFSGPRGCGKTTSARILARCLNCAEGPTDTPCGVCPSCVELSRDGGGSLDVVEIDAASHNGVDDARELRERAIFAPARDRYKIFILDEAHMVTPQGFNALLKIVEEPPAHIKFIFATTEPEKVIGTIRSRTHHYPFRLVPPAQMLEYLEQLCQSEGVQVEPGVLALVVRSGGGSVRDSLSLLDQLIAGSDSGLVTYDLAVALLGYTHSSLLDAVVDAFAAGDGAAVFENVDKVIQTGQDPRRFVEDLLEHLRDLVVLLSSGGAGKSVLRGIAQDEIEKMMDQAQRFGISDLTHAATTVAASLSEMTGATSPKLHLELMCAKVLVPAADRTEVGSLARLDRLERRIGVGTPAAPASAAPVATEQAPAPSREPAKAEQVEPVRSFQGVTTEAFKRAWPEIIDDLAKRSRPTWVIAKGLQVLELENAGDDQVLTLQFETQNDLDVFKKAQGAPDHLRKSISQVLGINVKFKPAIASASAPAAETKQMPVVSMPAPAPSLPAPAPSAPAAVAAPEPTQEPQETVVEPESAKPAKKGRAGLVHEGATYGEPLLREILGAEPVTDPKFGK
ncbi:MAG: DNA polymerase III subunit gamma and tau [Micrococcales bacterium]